MPTPPQTDPVFYYYHADHLGSASVMTNRSGQIVQHYGYSAFGQQRYKDTTIPAFDVTNRYTGQQIDEETGLYFYQSRCGACPERSRGNPELGRFIQADTIVPETDTSQALNRYTYVKNNPLKFTDPSGHGWFSKIWDKVKSWIGTIVTVALNIVCPGAGFLAALAFSAIGSAVGAAVNGGTWKSFAIGVAIGAAAGVIAEGIGAHFSGISKALANAGVGAYAAGALTGAVSGAISSGIYGGNWGQNMLDAAASGIIGAGVGISTANLLMSAKSFMGFGKDLNAYAFVKYKGNEQEFKIKFSQAIDFVDFMQAAISEGREIEYMRLYSEGYGKTWTLKDNRGMGLKIGPGEETGILTGWKVDASDGNSIFFGSIKDVVARAFAPNATVIIESCYSNYLTPAGESIAGNFKRALPNASVWGYKGRAWHWIWQGPENGTFKNMGGYGEVEWNAKWRK